MEKFEKWLTEVCFQKPTPEAYDLAKDAWKKALAQDGKFVYHYCLSYQLPDKSNITYVDGIAELVNKVDSMDGLGKFRKLAEPEHYDISTIRSLTLMGRK
tara:strand:- start:374 stop:673 length:300 start_codon:yes stop_codon:yes gene_type:complete